MLPKFILVFAALLFSTELLHSGILSPEKKAWQQVIAGQYAKALPKLEKSLKKDSANVLSNHAMALLNFLPDFDSADVEKANFHNRVAMASLGLISSEKKKNKLAKLGIRPVMLQLLQEQINALAYEIADSMDNLESWQHFINNYPDSDKLAQAIESRNARAFERASGKQTYESFKEFLENYPDAMQASRAQELYENLLYRNLTKDSTWQAYKDFFEKYPESPYANQAEANYERLHFKWFTADEKVTSYEKFVKEYPHSPHRIEAEEKIFRYYLSGDQPDKIQRFIRLHPENRNIAKAWNRLYLLQTYSAKTEDYRQFQRDYPDFPFKKRLLSDLALSAKNLIPFEDGDLFGYQDEETGTVAIPATFKEASPFSEGLAMVAFSNCERGACLYGFIRKDGSVAIEGKFVEAGDFVEGRALIGKGKCHLDQCLWGYIDHEGTIVIEPVYHEAWPFSDGLALVRKYDKGYGFIDRRGRIVIPLSLEDAHSFSEDMAAIMPDSLWGFMDKNGQIAISPKYSAAGSFKSGLAPVANEAGLWGYINKTGETVIPFQFHYASSFENNLARVSLKTKDPRRNRELIRSFFINKAGEEVKGD